MLHVSERGLRWADRISRSLQQLQSSSPSAVLSMSLDFAADHLRADGRGLVSQAVELGIRVVNALPSPLRAVRKAGVSTDPTKVVIDVRPLGMTGFDAAAYLRTKHRIWIELADQHRIVCSLSIGDNRSTADALLGALHHLAQQAGHHVGGVSPAWVEPTVARSPRAALQLDAQRVSLEAARDRVVAEYVIPYPPGIPLAVPGEVLTGDVLDALAQYRTIGSRIVGPNDPTGQTLLVLP
jgi:arginine decarboxylase